MTTTGSLPSSSLLDPDRPVDPHPIESTDYFVFRLYGRTYALAPDCVELVAAVLPIVAVPTTGPHVRGLIYLRGRIIAVIDLAGLLGIEGPPLRAESARLVVLDAPYSFAFAVDATLGIWEFAKDAQTRTIDDGPLVCGQIADRGGAATLLDPRAIVERVRAERP